MIAIRGAQVLAPDAAGFAPSATVVVDGERIRDVLRSPDAAPAMDAPGIEAEGRFLVPGLVDSHFHLVSRSQAAVDDAFVALTAIEGALCARRILELGVTTVRDAGCRHHGIHGLKRAIAEGLVEGPRAFVAGRNPSGSGGPPDWRNLPVDGVDSMRHAVREEWRAGADWIKLILAHANDPADWPRVVRYLHEDEIRAAVEEAHAKELRIGCHCEGFEVARTAVRCGMDCLDHAALLDEAVVEEMAARGTQYVPTLWAFSEDTGLDLARLSAERRASLERWQEEHRRSVQRAHAAGVIIGAGTDAMGSLPEADVLVRELESLVGAGLSRVDALRAATLNGARILGKEHELGSVEAGKLADLVLLERNPHEDLGTLRRPLLVMQGGRIVVDRLGIAGGSLAANGDRRRAPTAVTSRWD